MAGKDNANAGQKPGPWGSPPPSGGSGGGGSGGGDGGGSGGPKPGGPRKPRRPGGGAPPPPDLGDFGRQIRERLESLFGGAPGSPGVRGQTLAIVAGVAF